jgi:flagellar motor protein MotB
MRVDYENNRYRHDEAARRIANAEARAAAATEETQRITQRLDERERQATSCSAELSAARDGCLLAARTNAVSRSEALMARLVEAAPGPAVEVWRRGERVVVIVPERALFEPGEAAIAEYGRSLLERVGAVLNSDTSWEVAVNAHTDAAPPPRASGVRSNWEYSSLQAGAVARALVDVAHLEASRLSPGGFGASRPASPPDPTRNRRVELVLTYAERPNGPAVAQAPTVPTPTPPAAPSPRHRGERTHASARRTPRG